MQKERRLSLISELQEVRNSKVILYVLGDRQPLPVFNTKIALDVLPLFQRILKEQGKVEKISLFLYSSGGNIDTPWPLVNTIREFCKTFEVLIPRKALSAATLISLGANRVVMTPFSHLSPIDPEATFSSADGKLEQYQIEDIISFIDFSRDKIGFKKDDKEGLVALLNSLCQKVDPKILGSINRTHSLIRRLANGLLCLHLDEKKDGDRIKQIVEQLTEKLFSHQHLIGRYEAKDKVGFGDVIEFADSKTFDGIEKLFEAISADFQLLEPLQVQEELEKIKPKPLSMDSLRAVIQSEKTNYEGKSNISIFPSGQVNAPFEWKLV